MEDDNDICLATIDEAIGGRTFFLSPDGSVSLETYARQQRQANDEYLS